MTKLKQTAIQRTIPSLEGLPGAAPSVSTIHDDAVWTCDQPREFRSQQQARNETVSALELARWLGVSDVVKPKPVCTENLIRVDDVMESRSSWRNDRASMFRPGRLGRANQIEDEA